MDKDQNNNCASDESNNTLLTPPDEDDDSCSICFSSLCRGQIHAHTMKCPHRFCVVCLMRWMHTKIEQSQIPKCPLCRIEFEMLYIQKDNHHPYVENGNTDCYICSKVSIPIVKGTCKLANCNHFHCSVCMVRCIQNRKCQKLKYECRSCKTMFKNLILY